MGHSVNLKAPCARATLGRASYEINTDRIQFGHLGCKRLGTIVKDYKEAGLPLDIVETWNRRIPGWKKTDDACDRLAAALHKTLLLAGTNELELWDTMRKGSDYWRPGNLLTQAVTQLKRLNDAASVTYVRRDELCPSKPLLDQFHADESMSFGQYAEQYASELKLGAIEVAVAHVVRAVASGALVLFYCIDPFVPGYCDSSLLATTGYAARKWAPLRNEGCHRVILGEEVARRFLNAGFSVELYEVDQMADQGVHVRLLASQ